MRFAIASLSILAIASIIGTLLRQREPFANYVNQFGPFWAEQLRAAGVYEVYNAWWFLLVLAFLVVSTSVCVVRNTPKMLHEMRAWREQARESSLRAFRHRDELPLAAEPQQAAPRAAAAIERLGYRVRLDARAHGTMIAAKRGSANRLGYVFTHAGIVIICLGGLLDSELPLRGIVGWLDKSPLPANTAGSLAQVPAAALLPAGNPSWRGNMFVTEGAAADAAVLNFRDGLLVQDLPFRIELKRFRIEFYSSGMPKLFASDIELIDKASGAREAATIKVNEPLIRHGIAIYQSSFDDGGSRLKLRAVPLDGADEGFDVAVEVGGSVPLANGATASAAAAPAAAAPTALRLEVTGFRAVNVENIAQAGSDPAQTRKFADSVATVLSPAAGSRGKNLQNVGPSVQYKLRDAAGQAREYNVYMNPVTVEGVSVFLAGVRDTPNEPFRYLRIPADADGSMNDYLRLRAALADAKLRERAAQRYALGAQSRVDAPDRAPQPEPAAERQTTERLATAAHRSLDLFASGGLQAMAEFIERNIPSEDQEKAADALLKVLNGALWELWQTAREQAGVARAPSDEAAGRFLVLAQSALSDGFLFGAPMLFALTDFTEVKASVLQLTRSPGKRVVYLGSLALVLGVFAMFYVRERRVWCWVGQSSDGAPHALVAMSSTRQTIDLDREFDALRAALAAALPSPHIKLDGPVPGSFVKAP